MKTPNFFLALLPAILLTGCLEVEQHPGWINGQYDGKRDDMKFQRHFHNDRLAWAAAIDNRNQLQNEYGRTDDVFALTGVKAAGPGGSRNTQISGAASGTDQSVATRPSTSGPVSESPDPAALPRGGAAPAPNAKP